jgi:hypothetical protein
VHADAWVYSQFLPIDAGAATTDQALQALFYTEWALERIPLACGGELCQPSNWVPSKWSVRDMFNGDAWHLALAYFQTGLADEGWELLLGAMLETAYGGAVPGGFSHIGAGTDFSDCTSMFARVVVEGLFGYDPDLPNGRIRMRPAFPSSWPAASIDTPDYSLLYQREGDQERYHLKVQREAAIDFDLLVRAERVRGVTLDGRATAWEAEPGFGCTLVRIGTPRTSEAVIEIELADRVPHAAAVSHSGPCGTGVRLAAPRGSIVGVRDFHGALADTRIDGPQISGLLSDRPGHHLVLADVRVGELPQRQVFKIRIDDPAAEAVKAARSPRAAPAGAAWTFPAMEGLLNADVRTIFQQRYLSPRPETCSVRLGVDGYSAWTFAYWGDEPPVIDLSFLDRHARGDGTIMTPPGVPFMVASGEKNIAFTSLWDNWPRSVTVPVDRGAEAAWLLVCGTTFPMQLRIANAVLRFRYAGGGEETLEIVPPFNFWSLCPWGGLDYSYETDAFCLPAEPPPMAQLGNNCRAMVLSWRLRPGEILESVTLEGLSQEVVIGLMGISLANARS